MPGTSRSLLIDTNAAIARIAQDTDLVQLLEQAPEVFVSSITLGELYYGAEKSAKVESNLAQVDKLAAEGTVLTCDARTARWNGRIAQQLRAKGRPIPQNDMWIAALVLQHNLTLVTRDEHFKQVDCLLLETW